MDGLFCAYYRVSTQKQGASGLGLDAQQKAVREYLNGGSWTLVDEFTEVESGKNDKNRPKLAEAIARCNMTGAKLLIAKLDRLSRDVHFVSGLLKTGVEFVCCDMPTVNTFTIHILAAVAQEEREAISKRTKAALATIKDRLANGEEYLSKSSGRVVTKLGNPRGLSVRMSHLGTEANQKRAEAFAAMVSPTIKSLRDADLSLADIANRLNQMNYKTSRGSSWTPMAVKRVLDRV